MKYNRITVSKWKYHAALVVIAVLVVAIIFILTNGNQEFISPIPMSSANIEVMAVYKEPETIREKIEAVFGEDGEDAIKVAKCESGLNPKAYNKTSSARGLFQIMQSWHKIDEKWLFDPVINIQVAKQLFDEQGWVPWRASNHCHNML